MSAPSGRRPSRSGAEPCTADAIRSHVPDAVRMSYSRDRSGGATGLKSALVGAVMSKLKVDRAAIYRKPPRNRPGRGSGASCPFPGDSTPEAEGRVELRPLHRHDRRPGLMSGAWRSCAGASCSGGAPAAQASSADTSCSSACRAAAWARSSSPSWARSRASRSSSSSRRSCRISSPTRSSSSASSTRRRSPSSCSTPTSPPSSRSARSRASTSSPSSTSRGAICAA